MVISGIGGHAFTAKAVDDKGARSATYEVAQLSTTTDGSVQANSPNPDEALLVNWGDPREVDVDRPSNSLPSVEAVDRTPSNPVTSEESDNHQAYILPQRPSKPDPVSEIIVFSEQGWASWYGPGFEGNLTANGEIFNSTAITAAHPSLPFGTEVRVTNLDNSRSIVVRINDRGPYAHGRIVDLSAAAAEQLGMIASGTAFVRLEVLASPAELGK